MGILDTLFGRNQNLSLAAIDATTFEATGRRRKIEVVGERYHQPAIIRVVGRKTRESKNITKTATLVPDPRNRHDRNAVEVRIEGHLVAYLSREQALGYHALMSSKGLAGRAMGNVEARIYGGRIGDNGYVDDYGVAIYFRQSLADQIGYLEGRP